MQKVSIMSQSLKIKIDSKIEKLTPTDFAILNTRAETCEQDCSCTVYSLAFELKGQQNQLMSAKATKETAIDRKKCVSKIKNICQFIQ